MLHKRLLFVSAAVSCAAALQLSPNNSDGDSALIQMESYTIPQQQATGSGPLLQWLPFMIWIGQLVSRLCILCCVPESEVI